MQCACRLHLAAQPDSRKQEGLGRMAHMGTLPFLPCAGRAGLGLSGCQHPESSPGNPPCPLTGSLL